MTDASSRCQTIIGDSSPLIALAIINQLDLLPRLYQQVVVPRAVWEEVTVNGAGLLEHLLLADVHGCKSENQIRS